MRIIIETTDQETRPAIAQSGTQHAPAAVSPADTEVDADGGPVSEALLMALGGETTVPRAAPGGAGIDGGGPPASLEEMISSLGRALP